MADAIATPLTATPVQDRTHLSTWQQLSLSLYWFASSAHWTAILITLLPLQAERIGGSQFKGTTLGQILALGALLSMAVAPLFGAWSDRIRTRWGRRKPFLVIGTLGNVLGLLGLAFIPSQPSALGLYIAAYLVINLFNNLATAPYSALIPDVVPVEQRGSASGWMGLMTMLGNFVGGITGVALALLGPRFGEPGAITIVYLAIAVLLVVGMIGTVLTVREPEPQPMPPFEWAVFWRGLLAPFKSHDFSWVFWTRFLVVLGTFTVQGFILYFAKDVVARGVQPFNYVIFGTTLATDAASATSFFILALLAGAIISSLVAGKLSDRYGRKRMVYLSGGLQAFAVALLLFNGTFSAVVLVGIIFGLGYGAYQSVDWALASDVLPSEDDYAKDMGVWHVAHTLPQTIATPVAGLLLDRFNVIGSASDNPILGYSVIFSMAFVYFLLGTLLVRQVKGVR